MWECPDFYEVDGKHVLVVSPMAMMPDGLKFHVGHSVIYLTGTYDKKTHQLSERMCSRLTVELISMLRRVC